MVYLIIGKKGTGKTKKLVKLAQEALHSATGHVIFIDDDKRCMSELNYKIRFINTKDFELCSADELFGFVSGMIAGNYDTQKIFIDGLYKITDLNDGSVETFLSKLDRLCSKNDIDAYISISTTSENLPENAKKYILEELVYTE